MSVDPSGFGEDFLDIQGGLVTGQQLEINPPSGYGEDFFTQQRDLILNVATDGSEVVNDLIIRHPRSSSPVVVNGHVDSFTASVGDTLTITAPIIWTPAPDNVSYEWSKNGATIPGATGPSYTLITGDESSTITVSIIGSNDFGDGVVTSPPIHISDSIYMKGMHRGKIIVPAGDLSATLIIPQVGANAFVLRDGFTKLDDVNISTLQSTVELVNDHTLTGRINQVYSADVIIYYTVVDPGNLLVDSVQAGSFIVPSASLSATETITSVDLSRSIVIFVGALGTFSAAQCRVTPYLELTNATTITGTRNLAGDDAEVFYVVVEFVASVVQSVQRPTASFTTSGTTHTTTISSVDAANTIIFSAGDTTNLTGSDATKVTVVITNPTTVTFTRGLNSTATRKIALGIIEFKPGVLANKYDGTVNALQSNGAHQLFPLPTPVKGALVINAPWYRTTMAGGLGFYCAVYLPNDGENTEVGVHFPPSVSNVTYTAQYQIAEFA